MDTFVHYCQTMTRLSNAVKGLLIYCCCLRLRQTSRLPTPTDFFKSHLPYLL